MDLQLTEKTALITGGSRGIGRGVAEVLAAEGCLLHLAARTEADLEKARAELLADHGVEVTGHAMDLSTGDAARESGWAPSAVADEPSTPWVADAVQAAIDE